ncbi:unnamed protein product [Spirodela intermedia]|uniref:Uncharacterized protein n=1 Tax=Spirodela intermedia TaxID=51605 RepID=A0A7I8I7W1_SPIIN|nr:unnamed protein product [Spirodela intermedia]CAA6653675.1 unnamed protein product [Spirodela intermedia]
MEANQKREETAEGEMSSKAKQEDGHVKYRGWKAMPYVVGNETFEKLGTIGTSSNLLVYLTTVFHIKGVQATTLINVWNGSTNIATIAGAFLSDAYFGRYATLGFSSVASFLGMTVLTLTAAVGTLHPPRCGGPDGPCRGPTPWQLAFLLSGMGLMVVGAGGIRPCNLAFGVDQFNPRTVAGKRGINSFFNLYYVTFTASVMISVTIIVYVQSSISWAVGLAIPAFLMLLSCIFFFSGSSIYVKVSPEGSPFAGIARVAVAAVRKRRVELPSDGGSSSAAAFFNPPAAAASINTRLPRTDQFRFLDKAAVKTSEDEVDPEGSSPVDPWRLCSLQQVEEVKCLIRIIPILWAGTVFFLGITQQSTFATLQGLQTDRRLRGTTFVIPAASFIVFSMLATTLWLPFYDRVAVPWLRRRTGREEGLSLLQRIGTGLVLSVVSTVTAAVGLWLVPQQAISGLSEAFASIGQVEFYYKQFPENMRSVAGSFLFLAMAVGSYLSGFLVTVVHRVTGDGVGGWLTEDLNRGHLDRFYLLIAGLEVINFLYFLAISRWYRYKGSAASMEEEVELPSTSR